MVTNLALAESFDQRIDKNLFFHSDSTWLYVRRNQNSLCGALVTVPDQEPLVTELLSRLNHGSKNKEKKNSVEVRAVTVLVLDAFKAHYQMSCST